MVCRSLFVFTALTSYQPTTGVEGNPPKTNLLARLNSASLAPGKSGTRIPRRILTSERPKGSFGSCSGHFHTACIGDMRLAPSTLPSPLWKNDDEHGGGGVGRNDLVDTRGGRRTPLNCLGKSPYGSPRRQNGNSRSKNPLSPFSASTAVSSFVDCFCPSSVPPNGFSRLSNPGFVIVSAGLGSRSCAVP